MYQDWYRSYFKPYMQDVGAMTAIVDQAVADHLESLNDVYIKRKQKEIIVLIKKYIEDNRITKITLFNLLCQMYKDKVLRVNPVYSNVGKASQRDICKNSVPSRIPNYYDVYNMLLYQNKKWQKGLEVGELIIK